MVKRSGKSPSTSAATSTRVPALALVLAFVSSGAWLIVRLPPIPIAKATNLATAGLWALVFGLGLLRFRAPERRILWALLAVASAIAVSYLAAGSLVPTAVYDLFAEMPLVQWLAFPLVFVLASGMVAKREAIEVGLTAIVALGVVLVSAIGVSQVLTNSYGTFGSSAYSTTALAPLIPVAAGLASTRQGWRRIAFYAASAYIAAVLAFFAGSTMSTVAALFAVAVSVGLHPALRATKVVGLRVLRHLVLGGAGLLVAGLVFVQLPVLSGSVLDAKTLSRFDKNVVSRVYLWKGAQTMFAARPILGFGPSGYRLHAVEYLDPATFQFGADAPGSIDPTIYSPQSPHSFPWEIATRLGAVGLLAFAALLVSWATLMVRRLRDTGDPVAELQLTLGAAFVVALFALLVNPVLFAIGLFPAAAAGLAVSTGLGADDRSAAVVSRWFRPVCLITGAAVVASAIWLGVGEWRALQASSADPVASILGYERALEVIPAHPLTERRLLESRLLVATNATQVQAAQAAVDAAPSYMLGYAPNAVNFAAHSLAQAERTGRTGLAWEQGLLDRAAAVLPPIPSLVAERLHIAVLSADADAVRKAMPDAKTWGTPYPYTAAYLKAAEQFLAAQ